MREKKFIGYFIDDQKSIFFDSQEFSKVLAYVQKYSKSCTLKQKTTRSGLRLILTIEKIIGRDLPDRILEFFYRLGTAFLIFLFVFVFFNDIFRILS